MTQRKLLLGVAVLVAALIGVFLFRSREATNRSTFHETFPVTATRTLLFGSFHSVTHASAGEATVYELADGRRVLRLSGFSSVDAPGLQLYLVAVPDSSDATTVTNASFLNLGPLKHHMGDQNYEVPSGADLNRYRSVTIWQQAANVNVATAPLLPEAITTGHGSHLEH